MGRCAAWWVGVMCACVWRNEAMGFGVGRSQTAVQVCEDEMLLRAYWTTLRLWH